MEIFLAPNWHSIDIEQYAAKYDDSFHLGLTKDSFLTNYENEIWDIKSRPLIVADDSGEYISGAAIAYRKLTLGEKMCDAAVMCGMWTPEQHRGRGFMRKMISKLLEEDEKFGVHYMCGFGLMTNVSARFERGAGAFMHDVHYAFGGEIYIDELLPKVEETKIDVSQILPRVNSSFSYTAEQFAHQYELNSAKTFAIDSDIAIIQETYNSSKVNLLTHKNLSAFERNIKALIKWNRENNQKPLFLYTSDTCELEILKKYSFDIKDGYFSVLESNSTHRFEGNLNVLMGDRL